MTQPILNLTPEDEAEVAAMWAQQPRRPKMRGVAPLAPGTPTVTITCRVCGMRAGVEISAPAKLCRECAHDLPATRAHAEAMLAAAVSAEGEVSERWAQYHAALPDDLAVRYDRVHTDRYRAELALRQAERAKGKTTTTPAQQVAAIEAARAELDTVKARIAKTRANPQNPLAAVLNAEAEYHAGLQQAQEARQRWEIALQEIEAAEVGGVPF